jgi:hypothetical protein
MCRQLVWLAAAAAAAVFRRIVNEGSFSFVRVRALLRFAAVFEWYLSISLSFSSENARRRHWHDE